MAIADRNGLPVAIWTGSASPHEVTLVDATLDSRFTAQQPQRILGDKAYDSDKLDERMKTKRGIEIIAPHRLVRNRKKPPNQDGRPLRRYRRRWRVERLFAWLQNYRRIAMRYEHNLSNFLGLVHLACAMILLRLF